MQSLNSIRNISSECADTLVLLTGDDAEAYGVTWIHAAAEGIPLLSTMNSM